MLIVFALYFLATKYSLVKQKLSDKERGCFHIWRHLNNQTPLIVHFYREGEREADLLRPGSPDRRHRQRELRCSGAASPSRARRPSLHVTPRASWSTIPRPVRPRASTPAPLPRMDASGEAAPLCRYPAAWKRQDARFGTIGRGRPTRMRPM